MVTQRDESHIESPALSAGLMLAPVLTIVSNELWCVSTDRKYPVSRSIENETSWHLLEAINRILVPKQAYDQYIFELTHLLLPPTQNLGTEEPTWFIGPQTTMKPCKAVLTSSAHLMVTVAD